MSETKFSSDYSKRLSKCQKCKQEIPKGDARIAKLTANFFHDGEGEIKSYFHFACLFDTFKRARPTTKVIESADEIDGFAQLNANDKSVLIGLIADLDQHRNKGAKPKTNPSKKQHDSKPGTSSQKHVTKDSDEDDDEDQVKMAKPKQARVFENEDNANNSSSDMKLETFIKVCDRIAAQSGNAKTEVIREFLDKGTDKTGFKGDLALFIKFLLPGSSNRVYNLNSVSLVKLYSRLFDQDQDEMLKHLNNGDVANTIKVFFDKSRRLKPKKTSDLTLTEVDHYLNELTKHRTESDQLTVLKNIAAKCTVDDLHVIIRLIKKDLRINAGDKIVLEGVSKNAYAAYKVTRDLDDVVERLLKSPLKKDLSIKINLMKPIQPMLADACKSCENAIVKCPSGAYVEIKYDGERLQVHKNGSEFNYFSRNLKQVPLHKVEHLKQYIPKAFPFANELILDGEVLLYDMKTAKPLPFGTLGVHKKTQFKDASVCYFIFDIIYMNGKDLMNETLKERRKFLEKNVQQIPGHIMLSDQQLITKASKLREIMMKAINEGLEGLVIKDANSKYEPGKRHWLKMKKDYLDEGTMADTADLVVLGAYYGTGNKGGLKSVFLMGCFNDKSQKWQTVTKVGNGFDDKTIDRLQKELDMIEINKDFSKVPQWLDINRALVPDFVIRNPKQSPVWEITGAEFSNSDAHTAAGISIRFPRVTRIRDDKTWKEATNLDRLKELFKISKEKTDVHEEDGANADDEIIDEDQDEVIEQKPAKKRQPLDSDADDSKSVKSQKKKLKTQDNASLLPGIFSNVKIYIPSDTKDLAKLKRYIISYNGDIVDDCEIDQATHIVVNNEDPINTTNKKSKHVKLCDLWTCIKMRLKLDSI